MPTSRKKRARQRRNTAGRSHRFESLERRELMAADTFLFSLGDARNLVNSDGSVLAADDSDIVQLTVQSNGAYNHELYFDGSDVQLTRAAEGINGFSILPNGDLLMVTDSRFSVTGVTGDDEDILRFRPTQLGETTKGSWSLHFDGSDVGLGPNVDDIRVGLDGVSTLADGRLVLSVDDAIAVGGHTFQQEDLVLFTPTTLGGNTSGSFSLYLDGSDVSLGNSPNTEWEDINAVYVEDTTGSLPSVFVSVVEQLRSPGVAAEGEDVAVFNPMKLGANTTGRFGGVTLDGSKVGLGNAAINAIHLPREKPAPSTPNLRINNVSGPEGNSGTSNFRFQVTLSKPSAEPVRVSYATEDMTAKVSDNDYLARTGTVIFAPGQTKKTVIVKVKGDTKVEPNEKFRVRLTNPVGAKIADAVGVGTILNDTTPPPTFPPKLTINNVSELEGNLGTKNFQFEVMLSEPSAEPVRVSYATQDLTARVADNDYISRSGSLRFAPGQTKKTVIVKVKGDTKFEPNEKFRVRLTNPVGATIADAVGVGTILNDDVRPTTVTPNLRINNVSGPEGNSGTSNFRFQVTLSEPSAEPVRVSYATEDMTAKVSDNDYLARTGTVIFAPGQTKKTVIVKVKGDTKVEPNEKFRVRLTNPVGAKIADAVGIGTIRNDDTSGNSDPHVGSFYSLSRERDVTNSDGSVLRIKPEDIIQLTVQANGNYHHSVYFDGSDVGLAGEDVKAYTVLPNGDLLMAIEGEPRLVGRRVYDEDIMRFRPTSLGETTRGQWSTYFVGSDFGIGPNTSGIRTSINGLSLLPDGSLVMALTGIDLPSVGRVESQDLIRFVPRGPTTIAINDGVWERYFDGSDQQLSTSLEAISALHLSPRNNSALPEVLLSTTNDPTINGKTLESEDVFSFLPNRLGEHTRGTYRTNPFLTGTDVDLNFGNVDAFFYQLGSS